MASEEVRERLRSMCPKARVLVEPKQTPPPKRKRIRAPALTASAKKARRTMYNKRFRAKTSNVQIQNQYQRWTKTKESLGLLRARGGDEQLAKLLLDLYDSSKTQQPFTASTSSVHRASAEPVQTSTPGPAQLHLHESTPGVSEISAADSESAKGSQLSGVGPIVSTDSDTQLYGKSMQLSLQLEPVPSTSTCSPQKLQVSKLKKRKLPPASVTTRSGRLAGKKTLSASFMDPFELTLDATVDEEEAADDQDADPDFEATFCLTAVLPDELLSKVEDVAYEEAEFGLEKEEEVQLDVEQAEEEVTEEEEALAGIIRVKTDEACETLVDSTVCLAYVEQLKTLARLHVSMCIVEQCKHAPQIHEEFVGSACYLKWVCCAGHESFRWCSQPILNRRVHSGDFLIACTLLFSGNNYSKMRLWAEMLKLKFPGPNLFHAIQRCYLVPTVDGYWEDHQQSVIQSFAGQSLVVLGDGRNDSPGHCAQYLSYTIMEEASKKILSLKTVDKRETEKKSTRMEKQGFVDAMTELLGNGVSIKEVVTDAHVGIGYVMRTTYAHIKHSNDVWHVAKNLGKKLMKICTSKDGRKLLPWVPDIINHFWFSCKTANSRREFVVIWKGVLHHIIGEHSWIDDNHTGIRGCLHGVLPTTAPDDKQCLHPKEDCLLLKKLSAVVLDSYLLNRADYVLSFRSTAVLEVFHQHLLMYCAKRFAYTPPVYRARNLLAAIDHNNHSDRDYAKNRDGDIVYHRCFNKKTGRWSVFPEKEKKHYDYIRDLVLAALKLRIHDRVGMKKQRPLEAADPRRRSRTLHSDAPPPTAQLVAEKKSRYE